MKKKISRYSHHCMIDLLHDTDDHVALYAEHMDPFLFWMRFKAFVP